VSRKKRVEEKKHTFQIWLLKNTKNPTDIFKEIKNQKDSVQKITPTNAPKGSLAYTWQAESEKNRTWWQEYWSIEGNLAHSYPNAIIFIPIEERWFALSQGYASSFLKNEYIETQFAYYTVLNVLDPNKITTTKVFQPDTSLRQLTEKSAGTTNLQLPQFGLSTSIVRDLSGNVKVGYEELFSSISGGSGKALKIQAIIDPNGFQKILMILLERYQSKDYETTFPELVHIQEVHDTDTINKLESKLELALSRTPMKVQLALPEIIDGFDWVWRLEPYFPDNHVFDEFSAENIFKKISVNQETDILSKCKLLKVQVKESEEENFNWKAFKLAKCLSFDTEIQGYPDVHYFLIEDIWYRVDQNFLKRLNKGLESKLDLFEVVNQFLTVKDALSYPCERISVTKKEARYNKVLADQMGGVYLDCKNSSLYGESQVEPCDVYYSNSVEAFFIHNKFYNYSATLSHLFNQGLVSAQLFRNSEESAEKVKKYIEGSGNTIQLKQIEKLITNDMPMVVLFGILQKDEKQSIPKSVTSLPLFSKISLSHVIDGLHAVNSKVGITFIKYK
jgi:uncharacterized protein (TIGR04141 family)